MREEADDRHALDKALGDIHECAIAFKMAGFTAWATKLAEAHEELQRYLIEEGK